MCKTRRLRIWEEVQGIFKGLKTNGDYIFVVLFLCGKKTMISFPTDGVEAEILHRELSESTIGRKIAILRTDELERPILIRGWRVGS